MQVFSKGNITSSTRSRKSKKELVAAFPCMKALEPSLHGGAGTPPASWEPWAGGTPAARKCCYQTPSLLPKLNGKSNVALYTSLSLYMYIYIYTYIDIFIIFELK